MVPKSVLLQIPNSNVYLQAQSLTEKRMTVRTTVILILKTLYFGHIMCFTFCINLRINSDYVSILYYVF